MLDAAGLGAATTAVVAENLNQAGLICLCALENTEAELAPTDWCVTVEGLDAEDLLLLLKEKQVLKGTLVTGKGDEDYTI